LDETLFLVPGFMPVRQNHRQYDQYHCNYTKQGSQVGPGEKIAVINKKQIANDEGNTETDDNEPECSHKSTIKIS
jgi:hypothetical protein